MTSVAGVDGCRGGWVIAHSAPDRIRLDAVDAVDELIDRVHNNDSVAIDMPMSLPIRGRRQSEL